MWATYIFHLSTRILTSTQTKYFIIFFAYFMSRWPTFTFQLSIMSKWLAKNIRTKESFKITIRKTHIWIDIRCPLKWNCISIWEFEMMNVLKYYFAFISDRYTIKFKEQKWNKFINELWHIYWYMNISNSNWHKSIFDSTKMKFLPLFQFLTRLLNSKHLNLIST